jgi:hypothetical protein
MFDLRILGFELQIFISFGFGLRFFNSYELVKLTFLMFGFRILGFELQNFISCGFGFRFSIQIWCQKFGF